MSDILVKCDASGFVCKKSETRKMWNGMIVRKDFWEPRHPQDFLPNITERSPRETRPDQNDPALLANNVYYDLVVYYDLQMPYEAPVRFDVSMII